MWQGEGKVQKPSGYTAEIHSVRGTASRGGFQHDGGMTHGLCNRELRHDGLPIFEWDTMQACAAGEDGEEGHVTHAPLLIAKKTA